MATEKSKEKYLVIVDHNDGMAHVQNVMIVTATNELEAIKAASKLQGYDISDCHSIEGINSIVGNFAYFREGK